MVQELEAGRCEVSCIHEENVIAVRRQIIGRIRPRIWLIFLKPWEIPLE